jgi:Golgi phosphoprotein 3
MATSGLSRRRVANASSSQNDDELGVANGSSVGMNGGSVPVSPSESSANICGSTWTSHAGSAFEGGSKVAFDPRDLEREDEDVRAGGRMPKLTIMEEVLLLGLKDKQVRAQI